MALSKRLLIFLFLAGAGLTLSLVNDHFLVSASDQNRSKFLATFDPTSVVLKFAQPLQTGTGAASGAGSAAPWARRDVTHEVNVKWYFAPGQHPSAQVFKSLSDSAQTVLRATGAMVVSEQTRDGVLSIAYRDHRIRGTIEGAMGSDATINLTVKEFYTPE
jgi:hypothetical protein